MTQNILVFYPGRFQPFHLGHAETFRHLKEKFPQAKVFMSTSNSTKEDSPFSFEQKKVLMEMTGIPSESIICSSQPYFPFTSVKNEKCPA